MEATKGLFAEGQTRHPATPAQESLWFLDRTLAEPSIYNIPFALRLEGPLDVEALSESFQHTLQRHEVVLLGFEWSDKDGLQRHANRSMLPSLERVDLSHLDSADQQLRLDALKKAIARHRFDLDRGPLITARLAILGPETHVLLFCVHHIVFDAWSYYVLMTTWKQGYRQLREGGTLPPPEPDVEAMADRPQRSGTPSALEMQKRYWQGKLAGVSTTHSLVGDRRQAGVPRPQASSTPIQLPRDQWDRVVSFARKERGSPFMAILTAFQILLARLSSQEDVVVGAPVSGRSRPEHFRQVGYFVNTLALRTDLSGTPSFREAFSRVRETVLGGLSHADLPFQDVVQLLAPPRTPHRHPVFQTMVVLHSEPQHPDTFQDVEEFPESIGTGVSAFDLQLLWSGASGRLEYRTDLFEPATAEGFAMQFQRVLVAMVDDPDRSIAAFPLLDATEQRQERIRGLGATEQIPEEGLHEAFLRMAAQHPDARAAHFGEKSLTYRQLEHLSRQIALGLLARNIDPGTPVGIFMAPCLEQLTAQLGILRAGGAYVPMDPEHPSFRHRHVVEETGLSWILTHPPSVNRLPPLDARVLNLDLEALATEDAPLDCPPSVRLEDRACILFTSGSTGRPKGVVIQHRGMVNILGFMERLLGIDTTDRFVGLTPLGFDISSVERLLPLRAGASVHLLDLNTTRHPQALKQALEQLDPTVVFATPTTWQMLSQAGWRGNRKVKILCGGETLHPSLGAFLLDQAGEVWNLYGPTETTILSTFHRLQPDDLQEIPIGRPIWNTHIQILDQALQPVPPGVLGEICIGGAGLAAGYMGRNQETLDRFPTLPDEGTRTYRTGDLGRWLGDGSLAYGGRCDQQVKLRGFRIELEEIETALGNHPDILQGTVVLRQGEGGEFLAAFLGLQPGAQLDEEALRAHLKAQLPPYMIPSRFCTLERFPERNGKVDRDFLQKLPLPDPVSKAASQAPRGPSEILLMRIWSDLLGRSDFGIHDDFFDFGGHSLLVMQLSARIEQAFGRTLPPAVFFEKTTIQHLGQALAKETHESEQTPWIQLQASSGDRRSGIIYFHGDIPGLGLYARRIAGHTRSDWAFHLIHPHGLGGQPPARSMAQIVEEHANLVLEIQPEGPYRLAGYCNGAVEALEVARYLMTRGACVERVVLVAPSPPKPLANDRTPRQEEEDAPETSDALRAAMQALFHAVGSHRVLPYPGAVTVLQPCIPEPPRADPSMGWRDLLPSMECHLIEGNHVTCLAHASLGISLARAFGAGRD